MLYYTAERHAEVAQLVEQLIRNEQVVGSSPIFGSKIPHKLRNLRGPQKGKRAAGAKITFFAPRDEKNRRSVSITAGVV